VHGKRDALWVGGKHGVVVYFPRDPALHERHVFQRRKLNGLVVLVEPCI
jgi:hypothetical protein